jgi:hypothetical protein
VLAAGEKLCYLLLQCNKRKKHRDSRKRREHPKLIAAMTSNRIRAGAPDFIEVERHQICNRPKNILPAW